MTTAHAGTGAGHAKLILTGEHWVIDGARALAVSLPLLRTEVRLQLGSGELSLQSSAALDAADIAHARQMIALAGQQVGRIAQSAAISSNIAVRRRLGSSAALAVACVRAAADACGTACEDGELVQRARQLEAIVHGQSSGLDPAAASAGQGAVLWQAGRIVGRLAENSRGLAGACWLLVDVGPGEPTAQAIAKAGATRQAMAPADRNRWQSAADAAADQAYAALGSGDLAALAAAIQQAEQACDVLQIATPPMQSALTMLRQAGAMAAKPTGAGFGGCVFGLFASEAAARAAAASAHHMGFACMLHALVAEENPP